MPEILIVEADLGSAAALAVALRVAFGMEIAVTTAEALHRLSAFSPRAVVVVVGPRFIGHERASLVSAIRVRRPGCRIVVRAGDGEPITQEIAAQDRDHALARSRRRRGARHVPRRPFACCRVRGRDPPALFRSPRRFADRSPLPGNSG